MQTSRGGAAGAGGVGVWNYKDRPSLWDTLAGDWRRRARRERSKAATISGALQRPNPQKCLLEGVAAAHLSVCRLGWGVCLRVLRTSVASVLGYCPAWSRFLGRLLSGEV